MEIYLYMHHKANKDLKTSYIIVQCVYKKAIRVSVCWSDYFKKLVDPCMILNYSTMFPFHIARRIFPPSLLYHPFLVVLPSLKGFQGLA